MIFFGGGGRVLNDFMRSEVQNIFEKNEAKKYLAKQKIKCKSLTKEFILKLFPEGQQT